MDTLSKGLAIGEPITIDGKVWHVAPLDILDFVELGTEISRIENLDRSTKVNPLDKLDYGKASHILTVAWLMLRKSDPELSETDRDDCRYRLSKRDVRAMLDVRSPSASELFDRIMELSGIKQSPAEVAADAKAEGDSPNAPAPSAPKSSRRPSKKVAHSLSSDSAGDGVES